MREITNYQAFIKPAMAVCAPGDPIAWQSFSPLSQQSNNAAAFLTASPALGQIAIVFAPVSNAQNFDVSIDAEWTMAYTANPLMESLHTTHPEAGPGFWHTARNFVSNNLVPFEEIAAAGVGSAAAIAAAPELAGAGVILRGANALRGAAGARGLAEPLLRGGRVLMMG